jgi:hypothetical protein
MADNDKNDKSVVKKIQDTLGSSPQSVTSVLRAWKEGRISGSYALKYLGSRLLKKKKGGAVKKYSHGGGVSSGHQLTYKRK